MAIVLLGDTLTQNADATEHTINVGSPSEDEFLLMLAVADSGTGTGLTTPATWNSIADNEIANPGGSGSCRYLLCWKFAGAAEANPSFTLSAAQEVVASVARFSGVDTSSPINVTISSTAHAIGQNNGVAPELTTTVNGAVWVAGLVNDDDRENRGGAAALSLIRSAASNALSNGNGVGLHWRYAEVATAGLTGTATFTLGTSEECEAFSLALTPSAGGAQFYTLTAESGDYSYSGQAATLIGGSQIAAEQGTYSILGSEGLVDIEMDAVQGSYALTGQAADLEFPRELDAEQGSYALTGQNAALSYSGAAIAAVDYIVRNVRRVMRRGWPSFGRY